MQDESWNRGQMFDRMAALAGFVGASDFWADLDKQAQREYATICRPSPRKRLFALELWQGNEGIQVALAEYRKEKDSEAVEPSNVEFDY